jgi:hypothetical protein
VGGILKILFIAILIFTAICSAQDTSKYFRLDHAFVNNKTLNNFYHTEKSDSGRITGPTFGSIIGELLLAPVTGVACAVPFTIGGIFVAVPYMYLGYVIGSSLSVFLITEEQNSDVSFWATLGFGFAGAGAAIGYLMLDKHRNFGADDGIALLSLPVIFEVLFTNLIISQKDNHTPTKSNLEVNSFQRYSYRDIYNSTLIFNAEIFRFNF